MRCPGFDRDRVVAGQAITEVLRERVVHLFVLDGWSVPDRAVESGVVEPPDPAGDGVFDLLTVASGAAEVDEFGLEGAAEGFGHGVVVGPIRPRRRCRPAGR